MQITTASKVSGDALTSLANIPAGAGSIPIANIPDTVVKTSGDQTIAGIKTLSSIPVLPASDPTTDNQATRKAYVDAKGFTDRGDASASDLLQSSMITDGTWRDWDISAVIPAGTKAVLLHCEIQDDGLGNGVGFRKNGNVNTYTASYAYIIVANQWHSFDLVIACDTNRIIEYQATNTTWSNIDLRILGWWG